MSVLPAAAIVPGQIAFLKAQFRANFALAGDPLGHAVAVDGVTQRFRLVHSFYIAGPNRQETHLVPAVQILLSV